MSHSDPPALPFLDPTAAGFSMRSAAVAAARARSWCAKTPYGIAVLQYDAVKDLVKHPCLRQGSGQWPDHNHAHGDWARAGCRTAATPAR